MWGGVLICDKFGVKCYMFKSQGLSLLFTLNIKFFYQIHLTHYFLYLLRQIY